MVNPGEGGNMGELGGSVPLKVKAVTNYYVTEVTFEPPVNLSEVQELVKGSKSNAEVIGMFNNGGALGISMKQRARIPAHADPQIRELLGIKDAPI